MIIDSLILSSHILVTHFKYYIYTENDEIIFYSVSFKYCIIKSKKAHYAKKLEETNHDQEIM